MKEAKKLVYSDLKLYQRSLKEVRRGKHVVGGTKTSSLS